ncbi:hypothetical protein KLQUMA228M_10240 [Klebsiella quasipneumoniae subsp. quasipneumoniae]|nr:Uncharacterised protein [Klebsiella pneumoniae]VGD19793.1 Uncharacterised protein [Klebsiella pneumoniae]
MVMPIVLISITIGSGDILVIIIHPRLLIFTSDKLFLSNFFYEINDFSFFFFS